MSLLLISQLHNTNLCRLTRLTNHRRRDKPRRDARELHQLNLHDTGEEEPELATPPW